LFAAEVRLDMMGSLAQLGFLASAPMWLAATLLLGGGVLLAWPMIRRRVAARAALARERRVPTIAERVGLVEATARQREELAQLIEEAKETIRLGCAQLDERLDRLERSSEAKTAPEPNGHIHVRPSQPAAAPAALRDTSDPVMREVYALADEGKSAMEIATQLDEHAGKVELMLALRRV
jgi:hypothetical protein